MPANILNLPDYKVVRVEESDHDYHVYAEVSNPPGVCTACGSDRLIGHGRNEQVIRDAISRSMSHNEIVRCEINGGDIHDLVSASVSQDWDYSSENRDDQGREVLDAYSTDDATDQWRIKVTIDVQNHIFICGSPIEYDQSGVGHAWTAAMLASRPPQSRR
jgi:hypothetical protein